MGSLLLHSVVDHDLHTAAQDEVWRAWFQRGVSEPEPGDDPYADAYKLDHVLWFGDDAALDGEMARFAALVDDAARGALDGWAATPRGALALVLLLHPIRARARHRGGGDRAR